MQKCGLGRFGGHAVSSCKRPWNRSQGERQCQLKVNIMSNRKMDKLSKDISYSYDLAYFVLCAGEFPLGPAS